MWTLSEKYKIHWNRWWTETSHSSCYSAKNNLYQLATSKWQWIKCEVQTNTTEGSEKDKIADTKYFVWKEGTVTFVVEEYMHSMLICNEIHPSKVYSPTTGYSLYREMLMWMALDLLFLSEIKKNRFLWIKIKNYCGILIVAHWAGIVHKATVQVSYFEFIFKQKFIHSTT